VLRRLAVLGIIVVGGIVLLGQLGGVGPAIGALAHANRFEILVAASLGASTYVAAAIAVTAAVGRRLPLGRTTAAQFAAACTNRIAPAGVGAMVTNVRYLEAEGAPRREAVTAMGITSIASFGVHVALMLVALPFVRTTAGRSVLSVPALPSWAPLALAGLAVAAVLALRATRSRLPRVVDAVRGAARDIHTLARDPHRVMHLLGGTVGVTLGHGLAFAVAVRACGVGLPLVALIGVFLAGSSLANAAPTPGGLGPLEAALASGLTGLGAATAPAVAGVLAFRLVTYWLPIIPGAFALRTLRSKPGTITGMHDATGVFYAVNKTN
jgi:undecaprenyl-diphosphatase